MQQTWWVLVWWLSCGLMAAEPGLPTRGVLLIGIDGCRWDAVVAARTPHLDHLVAAGTLAVGTDIVAPRPTPADTVSGPGWSNILCGVWPDKHGVIDNRFHDAHYERYPHFFVRIKEVAPHIQTASFTNWEPLHSRLTRQADHQLAESAQGADQYRVSDRRLAEACARWLTTGNPQVVVLYQGQVDETGHRFGFHPDIPEYRDAIERVDDNVGLVLQAVQQRREDWLVLVATDHGGEGKGHGGGRNNDVIRKTFLIVSGPSAQRGTWKQASSQVDVVRTALHHLQIEPRQAWELDGHVVGLNSAR
ncbi:MAG: nucleotide pyrophosphatase [Planctomycetaceae bacterium]|nr:MAG: nucleotide pyrophosphatase [Planctomycetaceae bacterium]